MSEKTDKLILDLIKQHYRPFDTHEGHCHVNRKFADQMTVAVTVHAATVAWRQVSMA